MIIFQVDRHYLNIYPYRYIKIKENQTRSSLSRLEEGESTMNYFEQVISRLSLEEIEILNSLTSQESLSRYTARSKQDLMEKTNLSETLVRKIISRLEAMCFVEVSTGNRRHLVHVTDYGLNAIQYIYERNGA